MFLQGRFNTAQQPVDDRPIRSVDQAGNFFSSQVQCLSTGFFQRKEASRRRLDPYDDDDQKDDKGGVGPSVKTKKGRSHPM